MTVDYQQKLKRTYEEAVKVKTHSHISMVELGKQFESYPDWCIGPYDLETELTFNNAKQWNDPANIGWKSESLFNPSLIEHDGMIFMYYRAAPKKEGLSSRIGLAVYTPASGWEDYQNNPLIYSTTEDEIISVEDPKVYKREDGKFIMYYNGVSSVTEEVRTNCASAGVEVPDFVCSIKAAISTDLYHWEKIGAVVPTSISRYWAKAAVIPREPSGKAVLINGVYIMYISEGCGGKQYTGFSNNLIDWTFEQINFLDINGMGILREVACAVARYHTDENILLLDFFYHDQNGIQCGAQTKYSIENPFTQQAINKGGTLSWGGIIKYNGKWLFAQGWDAKQNTREIYFYSAPIRK